MQVTTHQHIMNRNITMVQILGTPVTAKATMMTTTFCHQHYQKKV
jgi:hypothetical protein